MHAALLKGERVIFLSSRELKNSPPFFYEHVPHELSPPFQVHPRVLVCSCRAKGRALSVRLAALDRRACIFSPLFPPAPLVLMYLSGGSHGLQSINAFRFSNLFPAYVRTVGVLSGAESRRLGGGHALGEARGFRLPKDGEGAGNAHSG